MIVKKSCKKKKGSTCDRTLVYIFVYHNKRYERSYLTRTASIQ